LANNTGFFGFKEWLSACVVKKNEGEQSQRYVQLQKTMAMGSVDFPKNTTKTNW
jgi:hypothetical protein